jgi:hypothetical protein
VEVFISDVEKGRREFDGPRIAAGFFFDGDA